MLITLIEWLRCCGRIREGTVLAEEFRWYGRHVDLAMLSGSGQSTSFELKIKNNRRAIEQAAYNQLAFDRSYVVTASTPTHPLSEMARAAKVGIILLTEGSGRILQGAARHSSPLVLRRRLLLELRSQGRSVSV